MNNPEEHKVNQPGPTADALKLNFDMTKQVMTTTATVITLLAIYLKASETTQSVLSGAFAKVGAVLLLISLLLGIFGMGRQIGQFEEAQYSTQDSLTRRLGMAQHGTFILGMISVLLLILIA